MIDFKSEGPPTYRALRELLQQYHDICTSIDHGVRNQRAVDIIISGNRPFEEIAAQAERRVMVDGRINEQTADVPVELVPLVSDRWTRFFQWRGEGPMPEQELRRLKEMIDATHAVGRRIRFWATPDDPRVWSVLVEAGVDLIGCDDLEGLASFLRNNPPRRGESTK